MENSNPAMMFCGHLGIGKTTISKYILEFLHGYVRFNTDEVRRKLGFKKFDRADTPKVNQYMYSNAREMVKNGMSIMFDSTYKTREARQRVYDICRELNKDILVIECICSPEEAKRRITRRPGKDRLHAPTNKIEDYLLNVSAWEPISKEMYEQKNSHVYHVKLDTEIHVLKICKSPEKEDHPVGRLIEVISKAMKVFPKTLRG